MDPLGFLSVSRPADLPRQAGPIFLVVVEKQVGPNSWRVRLNGNSLTVVVDSDLQPGQQLRVRLVSERTLQILSKSPSGPDPASTETVSQINPLMAAFFSRGLAVASEKLLLWSKWLSRNSGPSDHEGWVASLEARGSGPVDILTTQIQPWLAWQANLEQGNFERPPDGEVWDLWNSTKVAGDPWLTLPLKWEYKGKYDSGLLQAHYNQQRQGIDRWYLTACPLGIPFRIDASCNPSGLDLTWHFFNAEDLAVWKNRGPSLQASLSAAQFPVTLRVTGRPQDFFPGNVRGVDVKV